MHKLVSALVVVFLLAAVPSLSVADDKTFTTEPLIEDEVLRDFYVADDPRGGRRNRVEIFGGGANFAGISGGTGGASYEYRLNNPFGIAVTVMGTGGDFEVVTVAIPFYYYSVDMIRLMGAPAWVSNDGESTFVFQFGILWDFFINHYTFSPTAVFYVRDDSLASTIGISFGRFF